MKSLKQSITVSEPHKSVVLPPKERGGGLGGELGGYGGDGGGIGGGDGGQLGGGGEGGENGERGGGGGEHGPSLMQLLPLASIHITPWIKAPFMMS